MTWNGGASLGQPGRLGRVAAGQLADLVIIDTDGPRHLGNPALALPPQTHAASSSTEPSSSTTNSSPSTNTTQSPKPAPPSAQLPNMPRSSTHHGPPRNLARP